MAACPVVRIGKIVSPAKAFKGGFWAVFPGSTRYFRLARSRKPTGGSRRGASSTVVLVFYLHAGHGHPQVENLWLRGRAWQRGGSRAAYGRRRISAARSVFDISIATVIGPTPPGTGEIHPATSLTGP